MRKIIVINIFLLFVLSCNDGKKQQLSSSDTLPANVKPVNNMNVGAKKDTITSDAQKPLKDTSISVVLNKMEKRIKLNDADYEIISAFLLQNTDESLSEGVGYSLFEYLKNNRANNDAYSSFLSKKGSSYKEKVLVNLVEIMCIDLGEDNYTYEKLLNDFSLFKGSASAPKSFNACMNNQ